MILFTLLLLSVFVVDQIFKYLIRANIKPGDTLDTFIPFLRITYVKNTGAAFGSMSGMRIYLIIFRL